jgi:3-oxoacyl-[acyl-carrier protein] reductase
MLNEGAQVMINGRNGEKLEKVLEEFHLRFPNSSVDGYVGDVAETNDIVGFYDYVRNKWGNIDILVPAVGRGKAFSKDPLSDEDWNKLLQINLHSAVSMVRRFQSLLNENGSIVVISSIAGREVIGAPIAYAAGKQSLNVFVKYMSKILADRKIRMNAVMPGNVFFEGGRWEEILNDDYENIMQYISNSVPLKRFATPEEIANAVVFLASPKSSFTTGAILTVDGGQTNSIQ